MLPCQIKAFAAGVGSCIIRDVRGVPDVQWCKVEVVTSNLILYEDCKRDFHAKLSPATPSGKNAGSAAT